MTPSPVSAALTNARTGVLARLQELDRAVTVRELAGILGQHRNTVRNHLEALRAAGLVLVETQAPQGRGRPAATYRVSRAAVPSEVEYAALVRIMANRLGAAPDHHQLTEQLGKEWACDVMARVAAQEHLSTQPVSLLRELGFDPRCDDATGDVVLQRCPLSRVAAGEPDIICEMHLVMLRTVMAEQGIAVGKDEIRARPRGGRCRIQGEALSR